MAKQVRALIKRRILNVSMFRPGLVSNFCSGITREKLTNMKMMALSTDATYFCGNDLKWIHQLSTR